MVYSQSNAEELPPHTPGRSPIDGAGSSALDASSMVHADAARARKVPSVSHFFSSAFLVLSIRPELAMGRERHFGRAHEPASSSSERARQVNAKTVKNKTGL